MKSAAIIWLWLAVTLAARLGLAQASLPTAYTGPWQTGVPPMGWTFSGLGVDLNPDYDGHNNGAAKLDTTGDRITIHYNAAAGAVYYWMKSLTFSGGVFQVEQSVDGTNWTDLATYTELPTNAVFKTNQPALDARFVRFHYVSKGTGNVALDGIALTPYVAPPPPEIASFAATGGVVRVTLADAIAGRTYVLDGAAALTAVPVGWTPVDAQIGGGGALVLQDGAPTNAVRFYRVRDATP